MPAVRVGQKIFVVRIKLGANFITVEQIAFKASDKVVGGGNFRRGKEFLRSRQKTKLNARNHRVENFFAVEENSLAVNFQVVFASFHCGEKFLRVSRLEVARRKVVINPVKNSGGGFGGCVVLDTKAENRNRPDVFIVAVVMIPPVAAICIVVSISAVAFNGQPVSICAANFYVTTVAKIIRLVDKTFLSLFERGQVAVEALEAQIV